MRVKQLRGNDANRLLFTFNDWILDSLQTTSGKTVVDGLLVIVRSVSSDAHRDSSRVRYWLDWLNWAPWQSTISFVNTSWPSRGEQLHWAGQWDFRVAITSPIVHLTSSEPVLPSVGVASLIGPPTVGIPTYFWSSVLIWASAVDKLTSTAMTSCTQMTAKIMRLHFISLSATSTEALATKKNHPCTKKTVYKILWRTLYNTFAAISSLLSLMYGNIYPSCPLLYKVCWPLLTAFLLLPVFDDRKQLQGCPQAIGNWALALELGNVVKGFCAKVTNKILCCRKSQ